MTHELTYTPVKLHYVDLLKGTNKITYVFIGEVEDKIKRELLRIEKIYNKKSKAPSSSVLKGFYGKKWQDILGVSNVKGGVEGGIKGGDVPELVYSLGMQDDRDDEDRDEDVVGGADDNTNNTTDNTTDNNTDNNADNNVDNDVLSDQTDSDEKDSNKDATIIQNKKDKLIKQHISKSDKNGEQLDENDNEDNKNNNKLDENDNEDNKNNNRLNDNEDDRSSEGGKEENLVFDISQMDLIDSTLYEAVAETKPEPITVQDEKQIKVMDDAKPAKQNVKLEDLEDGLSPRKIAIDISQEDLADLANPNETADIFVEKSTTHYTTKQIKFIFDIPIYPADNILEFK